MILTESAILYLLRDPTETMLSWVEYWPAIDDHGYEAKRVVGIVTSVANAILIARALLEDQERYKSASPEKLLAMFCAVVGAGPSIDVIQKMIDEKVVDAALFTEALQEAGSNPATKH